MRFCLSWGPDSSTGLLPPRKKLVADFWKPKHVSKWLHVHRNQVSTLPTGSKFDFRVIPHVNSCWNLQNKGFIIDFVSIFGVFPLRYFFFRMWFYGCRKVRGGPRSCGEGLGGWNTWIFGWLFNFSEKKVWKLQTKTILCCKSVSWRRNLMIFGAGSMKIPQIKCALWKLRPNPGK